MAHPLRQRLAELQAEAEATAARPACVAARRAARGGYSTMALAIGLLSAPTAAQAQAVLPQGGRVAAGSATITPGGNTVTVNQTSAAAVIDWNRFDIGAEATVTFNQPDVHAVTLGRVTGDSPSTIAGRLEATGQLVLINPNGIAITPSGLVKVGGGFIASTLALAEADASGKLRFKGPGHSASVSNAGQILVGAKGFAALVGGAVANSGTITVPMGHIALAGGEAATIDTFSDGYLQVLLPGNLGADGSRSRGATRLQLSGEQARTAWRGVVAEAPARTATSARSENGAIVLGATPAAGSVRVSGTVDVGSASGGGGTIALAGAAITLTGARLNASGATGGAIAIGGGAAGAPIGGMAAASSTSIDAASTIEASGSAGAGGKVTVWGTQVLDYAGTITATGRGGDGGEAEVSGTGAYRYTGFADLRSTGGRVGNLLLDPGTIIICHTGDAGCSGAVSLGTVQADASTTDTTYLQDTTLASALAGAAVTLSASLQIKDSSTAVSVGPTTGGALTLAAPITLQGAYRVNGGLVLSNTDAASTVSGVISGPGGLTKTGAGTLTLTAGNTYTGATTISAGTLQIGNGGAAAGIINTSSIINHSNLAYSFNTAVAFTLPTSSLYSGTGNLSVTSGNVFFGGDLAVGGALTVNSTSLGYAGPTSSTLSPKITAASIAVIGSLLTSGANTRTLTFDTSASNGAIAINNITSGSPGVQFGYNNLVFNAGSGAITISGTNTFNWWSSGASVKFIGAVTGSGSIAQNYSPGSNLTLTFTDPTAEVAREIWTAGMSGLPD